MDNTIENKIVKEKKVNWIKGLDSLRFILAFTVLLSHFTNPWVEYLKQTNSQLLKIIGMGIPNLFSGIGAVIAFFIISGFVIHYPNVNGIPNVKKFLVRRWMRIGLPLLAVVIITSYFGIFYTIPIWSLYCELVYYTIYPLLSKIKITWKIKFIISFFIAALFIVVLAWSDVYSLIHRYDYHYNGNYWRLGNFITWIVGLPCWLLGVVLADKIDKYDVNISVTKIFVFRILLFVVSVLLNIGKFHYFLSYIVSMNIFALLIFVWIRAEILYYKTRTPVNFLEKMGAFSYSIYLLHSILFFTFNHFFILTKTSYFLSVILTLIISYFFYLAVEKPSHLFAKKIAAKIK